ASNQLIAEAQAASALDHPNVATIYQIGKTGDGHRFIAMARYEGETLRQRLSRGALAPREAFDIAKQVAFGLGAAHSAGLVHRDVKPENIFLTRDGLVKLLDFGIATLAGSPRDGRATRGTVQYMSPEHVRHEPADARGDVWSLGVVLYEMLAGASPFTDATVTEILARIVDPAPVKLSGIARRIPAASLTPLTRALEKDPRKRYANASHFAADLEHSTRIWSRPRRLRIGFAVAAALLLAISALGIRSGRERSQNQRMPELAVIRVGGDSSDSESMELAASLSDEIAARIVGLGRVRLVRTQGDSIGSVASHPNLHLLRLDIQRGRDGPVVAVSLNDAESNRTLWSDRRAFDQMALRELSRDVVVGILEALGLPATERERAIIGSGFPRSAEAYEEYIRGNRLLALRTPPAVESALVRFRRATRLDSSFASAFARQSYTYSLLVDWGWKPSRSSPIDPLAEGLALAEQATRLDSTSADAWLARAYVLALRDPRRFTGSVEAFQHAITLDPYNAEAFHQYGQTLMALGRYTEALAAYRRVMDLEPDRAMTLVAMAAINKRQGRFTEGLRLLDSAVSAAPRVPYARAARSVSRSQAGRFAEARADAEAGLALDSNYRTPTLAALVRAHWLAGDTSAARAALSKAEKSLVNPRVPTATEAYWLGTAEVVTGRPQQALTLLRNARPRGAWLWFYFQTSDFDEFRKDPEVAAFMADIDPRRAAHD
ncbi:MAG TPA: protein kinase, partial [Gemmatimonadaceae bacterium]|nr:protein kinase [Gemmatimonadaceae bacterium]